MLMEEKRFEEKWESEEQERTAVVRRRREIGGGSQEIKTVALISVASAGSMVRQRARCFFIYFLIDCQVCRLRQVPRMGQEEELYT